MMKGKILVAFFVALLAVAITGSETRGVGFSKECIDGIDNDNDGFIDWADSDCKDYPYGDGLGETYTQTGADYTSDYYEVTRFEYRFQYNLAHAGDVAYHCSEAQAYFTEYAAWETYSNGKDRSYDYFLTWESRNCP